MFTHSYNISIPRLKGLFKNNKSPANVDFMLKCLQEGVYTEWFQLCFDNNQAHVYLGVKVLL